MGDIPWDTILFGETKYRTSRMHLLHVFIPNILKFTQAILIFWASLIVVIVTSATIIDLMRDFTVVLVVSQADNILFQAAKMGYLGTTLQSSTKLVEGVAWRRNCRSEEEKKASWMEEKYLRYMGICFVLIYTIGFITALTFIAVRQHSGYYLREVYPHCDAGSPKLIGNGICDDFVPYNTEECGFDGGDCLWSWNVR